MVAFNSSRRSLAFQSIEADASWSSALAGSSELPLPSLAASATRRSACTTAIHRDRQGGITHIRIGRWRELTSTPGRRLAEMRQLADRRVAVRIERFADGGSGPSCDVWQLYSDEGRFEASLQTTPGGSIALMTDYRTRQACRLVRTREGNYRKAEVWRI